MPLNLSQEDIQTLVDALKPTIVEIANESAAAHVTKRNVSFEKKLTERFEQEKASFQQKQEPQEEDQEKLSLKALNAKLQENDKKLRDELKAEKEAGHRKSMKSSLEQQLLKGGIPASMLKAVVAQLVHEDKLVDIDQEGSPVFKVNSFNGEVLPLEDGVSQWMKTEGKSFVPQPVGRGAGVRSARSNIASEFLADSGESQTEVDARNFSLLRQKMG